MKEIENMTFSLKELLVGLKAVLVTTPPFLPPTIKPTTALIPSSHIFFTTTIIKHYNTFIAKLLCMNNTLHLLLHLHCYTPASLDCMFHKPTSDISHNLKDVFFPDSAWITFNQCLKKKKH